MLGQEEKEPRSTVEVLIRDTDSQREDLLPGLQWPTMPGRPLGHNHHWFARQNSPYLVHACRSTSLAMCASQDRGRVRRGDALASARVGAMSSKSLLARLGCVYLVIVAVLLATSSSCASLFQGPSVGQPPAWESFRSLLPVSEWNKSIEVTLANPPELKFSAYVVDVLVMNRAQEDISFGPDYGARALLYSAKRKTWVELDNEMTYVGKGEILVPKRSPDSNWAALVVAVPSIPEVSDGDLLRIAVVGRVVSSSAPTETTVGAYIDVDLPQ
jgi:hypothetical protein